MVLIQISRWTGRITPSGGRVKTSGLTRPGRYKPNKLISFYSTLITFLHRWTLDQYMVNADTIIHFTPMHKTLRSVFYSNNIVLHSFDNFVFALSTTKTAQQLRVKFSYVEMLILERESSVSMRQCTLCLNSHLTA